MFWAKIRQPHHYGHILTQVIKKQLAEGVTQRRVGLVSTGAPPRAHSPILNAEGKEVRMPALALIHLALPGVDVPSSAHLSSSHLSIC